MFEKSVEPIKNLIICNPYVEPDKHWQYNKELKKFKLVKGRRPAGFLIATQKNKIVDDPGEFQSLDLVNKIREAVRKWRADGYPNVTNVTKELLTFWNDRTDEEESFFFCQLEAIETIIWITEVLDIKKDDIAIPSDGSEYRRLCTKMATGTGKTIVMAMLIAWQVINKSINSNDGRFSKNILIVAPGLTVKKRLEVLNPSNPNNYFDAFRIVPNSLYERLYESNITIHNWHTITPLEDNKHGVVRKGSESDFAFARRVLEHNSKVIVINDEAHHAYREVSFKQFKKTLIKTTEWIMGLDRIHKAVGIQMCYDFSATPFITTGKNVAEEMLFKWIISDFSLNDAIESGLTKTPRIGIRDDSGKLDKNYKSRFYHMYLDEEVKSNLLQKAKPDEQLPNLVSNAYMILSEDWASTKNMWDKHNKKNHMPQIPPVMVSICNTTATASRVKYSFIEKKIGVDDLSESEHILHIDSTTLRKAEEGFEYGEKNEAEVLRQKNNTIGKAGMPGEKIRNVIAVQMINEGWDAKNVTHILGLRAFSSQLLCEQVVGRGLRRMSYEINPETNLLDPEYVNIFGVPFTFLPHEGNVKEPPDVKLTIMIKPDMTKLEHELSWPNIERVDLSYTSMLTVDWGQIEPLHLRADEISTTVGMAAVLEGKPSPDTMSYIDLENLNKRIRVQTIVFIAARDVYLSIKKSWKGNKKFLLIQVIKLVEEFIRLDKINVAGISENNLRKKITIMFNMQSVVQHVCDAIKEKSIASSHILLNAQHPMKSTGMMRPWYTKRLTDYVKKSHINLAVYDSKWEIATGNELERNNNVMSWVKNNHIGFIIKYAYRGQTHEYYPDFIVRLKNNVMLVLEIKGQDSEQDKAKRKYLKDWINAVNKDGRYGTWAWDVAFHQTEVQGIISKHMKTNATSNVTAKCPACNKFVKKRQLIEKEFGFRMVNGIIRPQSWCRKCRSMS